ncbi:hypothetical protein ASG29_12925 [Sphingomonas sp. Leaf412]|uniref:phosphatase PAP2 family protein n=1 Tax=Sphingomonas sp. Leaf412 TaxID=1736370 RepID=UPI0006F9D061|nr:phosphatase PAP2 family protein [Sphingomonas sp. Leaf412]KQT32637.1 hypothetical protein ASG29_12925 [Sphingomonas sp. Leaf412]
MTGAKTKKAARKEHRALAPVVALRDHPAVKLVEPTAKAADEPPLLALSLATLAIGAVLRRPAIVRTGARMVASHIVATGLKTVMKGAVDRTRPAAAGGSAKLSKGSGTKDGSKNAFPSGHTAGAVAVAQAVAHELPGTSGAARTLAGVAGALQVPRGAHYLTDVAAGAATGWLAERIAGLVLARIDTARADRSVRIAEEEAAAHPS